MESLNLRHEKSALIVGLPEIVDATLGDHLMAESAKWLSGNASTIIFDFKGVARLKPTAYRAFLMTWKSAKQAGKNIASLHMSPALFHQTKKDGVQDSFNPMAVEEASRPASAPAAAGSAANKQGALDVRLVNPFLGAALKTLELQAQTPSQPGKPYLVQVADKVYQSDIGIVGIITLSTSTFNGSIALVFNKQVFLKIYQNMVGEEHKDITPEIQDAAAELLNIIYGVAKKELNETPGYDLRPAIPTVLSGDKINVSQKTRQNLIILPFESAAGPFQMEIAMENN